MSYNCVLVKAVNNIVHNILILFISISAKKLIFQRHTAQVECFILGTYDIPSHHMRIVTLSMSYRTPLTSNGGQGHVVIRQWSLPVIDKLLIIIISNDLVINYIDQSYRYCSVGLNLKVATVVNIWALSEVYVAEIPHLTSYLWEGFNLTTDHVHGTHI